VHGGMACLTPRSPAVVSHTHTSCAPPCAAEINKAFELLHSGKCLRCVLTFDK
jgi:hypothetical protein